MDSESFSVTYEMRPAQDYLSQVFDLFPASVDIALDSCPPVSETREESPSTDEAKHHICQTCQKSCKTASKLVMHERSHSDLKPFACSSCPKRFKVRGDLKRHWRTHSGSRPFLCSFPGCGKTFTTTDIRKGHELIHQNQRNFKCCFAGCDKSFTNKRNLVNHENIHSQTKPYSCKTCHKRFIEYSSWYKHSRVHRTLEDEIQRVFKCRYCQNSYKNRSILQKHIKGCHESEAEDDDLPLLEQPDKIMNKIRIQICAPIGTDSDD